MLVMTWRMRIQCPKRVEQPDVSVLKTEEGAKNASDIWRQAWMESAPQFVLPTVSRPVQMDCRAPGPLSLEELDVQVEGSAVGLLPDSEMTEEQQKQHADQKWARLEHVAGVVIDSLPRKEFVHRPLYYSSSEETMALNAEEKKASTDAQKAGMELTFEERRQFQARRSKQRRTDKRRWLAAKAAKCTTP